jgi:hypothetical protein
MKKREAGNMVLHVVIGGALAALACWNIWGIVFDTLVYAFLREQAQHRYILDLVNFDHTDDGKKDYLVYRVTKRTFFDFGWLGWQQVFEIAQWTAGAAAAVGSYVLVAT